MNIDCPVSKTGTYTPLSEPYNLASDPEKRGYLLSPCPSWVKEAQELGTRSFRGVYHDSSLQMGRAGNFLAAGVNCMISCLLRQGQHWGALFALHLPCGQQRWFLLPEALNKWTHSLGMWPCTSPGRRTRVLYLSYPSMMELWSLFSKIFIFFSDMAETRNPLTALNSGSMRNDATLIFHFL